MTKVNKFSIAEKKNFENWYGIFGVTFSGPPWRNNGLSRHDSTMTSAGMTQQWPQPVWLNIDLSLHDSTMTSAGMTQQWPQRAWLNNDFSRHDLFNKQMTIINISKTNYPLINHLICTIPDTEQIIILILHYLIIKKPKNAICTK